MKRDGEQIRKQYNKSSDEENKRRMEDRWGVSIARDRWLQSLSGLLYSTVALLTGLLENMEDTLFCLRDLRVQYAAQCITTDVHQYVASILRVCPFSDLFNSSNTDRLAVLC